MHYQFVVAAAVGGVGVVGGGDGGGVPGVPSNFLAGYAFFSTNYQNMSARRCLQMSLVILGENNFTHFTQHLLSKPFNQSQE